MTTANTPPPQAIWHQTEDELILELAGDWRRGGPAVVLSGGEPARHADSYQTTGLGTYDSTLPAFLLARFCAGDAGAPPPMAGLPDNLRGLLELAMAVPEENATSTTPVAPSEIHKLGSRAIRMWTSVREVLDFAGETVLSLGRWVTRRACFRPADFWETLQDCGPRALPIVSLISFLIGSILAFVGSVQLANFGANLFVADLVGIAMVREMVVVMTAIIMSGRTGAAFADC